LIMMWLQVSIEFRPSVAEIRLIYCGRLCISPFGIESAKTRFLPRHVSDADT